MSVVRSPVDRDEQIIDSAVINCFLCGKALGFPFVYWSGCGPAIDKVAGLPIAGWEALPLALHPDCVGDLYYRMLRDVLELEGRQPPYRATA